MTAENERKSSPAAKITVAAMFCAIGIILPQIFHLIGGNAAGGIFLPMHLPVFLCAMICGWRWGAGVGLVLPVISSVLTGMPVMYPIGFSMMAELCAYGAVCGLIYRGAFKSSGRPAGIYISLIVSMLAGRTVSGIAKWLLMMGTKNPLTWSAFASAAFITSWPGIVIQLITVPLIIMLMKKAKISVLI